MTTGRARYGQLIAASRRPMTTRQQTPRFTFRTDQETTQIVGTLAERWKCSQADIVRHALTRGLDQLQQMGAVRL